ncbi:hypothetical protein RIF29_34201 [Crotalaria pallida]|uniref:Uncharacterized protein n=1 Tax=Crotalaria pallida TaxID=3830 RepID=A0AAN9E8P6_CROPI
MSSSAPSHGKCTPKSCATFRPPDMRDASFFQPPQCAARFRRYQNRPMGYIRWLNFRWLDHAGFSFHKVFIPQHVHKFLEFHAPVYHKCVCEFCANFYTGDGHIINQRLMDNTFTFLSVILRILLIWRMKEHFPTICPTHSWLTAILMISIALLSRILDAGLTEKDIPIPSDEEIMEPRSSSHCLNENLLHLAGIFKLESSGHWLWKEEFERKVEAEAAAERLRKASADSGRGGSAPMDTTTPSFTFDVGNSSTQPRVVSGWDVLKRKLMGHIDSRFDAFQTTYRADLAESCRQIREDLHAGFASVRAHF